MAMLNGAIVTWSKRPGKADVTVTRVVTIRARRSAGTGVSMSGPGFVGHVAYEAERLLEQHIGEAAEQLDAGRVPGFVVLAKDGSGLVGNHARALCDALRADTRRFEKVFGFIIYDTDVDSLLRRPVSNARIYLKSEQQGVERQLRALQAGGRVSLRVF
jgi:hypothetical protein